MRLSLLIIIGLLFCVPWKQVLAAPANDEEKLSAERAVDLLAETSPALVTYWKQYRTSQHSDDRDLYQDVQGIAYQLLTFSKDIRTNEYPRIFQLVERVLSDGSADVQELFVVGFLEDLQNITSHPDIGVSQSEIEALLGPKTLHEWKHIDEKWKLLFAESEKNHKPSVMTDEKYAAIQNTELRRMVQTSTRRSPTGRFVTLGDMIEVERSR